jgi:SAM-dependent methyltransferase
MVDRSNGYEGIASQFLAGRGRAPSTAVGTSAVRNWARTLPRGAAVIDLGCGSGLPITEVLVTEGLDVYGVDASSSLVEAFRHNLPELPVACESVEDSSFFGRTFDAVLAWGLIFLLSPEAQRRLIQRIGHILMPGGRLLFTSCAEFEPLAWNDAMTGLESRSLGAAEYRRLLSAAGLRVTSEYEDEGENHYFDALRIASKSARSCIRQFLFMQRSFRISRRNRVWDDGVAGLITRGRHRMTGSAAPISRDHDSITRGASPISRDLDSITRGADAVSRDSDSITRRDPPISRDLDTICRDLDSIS